MKQSLVGKRLEEVVPGAPAGVISEPNRWMASAPLEIAGRGSTIAIRGQADVLLATGDGSLGIVDLKTAPPGESHLPRYSRQLHAYGVGLENPAKGRPRPVGPMGLLAFVPGSFQDDGAGDASIDGHLDWIEVPRDTVAFESFLAEVIDVLDRPEPPPPSTGCPWCGEDPPTPC